MDQAKFVKGCLSQTLLGPFLNTLTHLTVTCSLTGKMKWQLSMLSWKISRTIITDVQNIWNLIGYNNVQISYIYNTFHTTGLFLHPLTTLEILWFADAFRGYRKRPVAWNRITTVQISKECVRAKSDAT